MTPEPIQLDRLLEQRVRVGRVVNFVCTVISGDVTEFLWARDGQLIRHGERTRIHENPVSSLLTIRDIEVSDAGNYTCVAKNAFSEDRVSTTLRVEGIRLVEERHSSTERLVLATAIRRLWASDIIILLSMA